jgi:predicted DNA-binding antitoxin AbrB/MazE fold protein
MTITVEATYEDGALKLTQPLPLKQHEKVQVTIHTQADWVERTAGLLGWKGSAEEAERFARDADLDFPPPAEAP